MAHNNHLFNAQYIDPKALYAFYFDKLPNVSYITEVDVNAALPAIRARLEPDLVENYQHASFNRETGTMEFNVLFLVMSDNRLVEVGNDYVTVFHDTYSAGWTLSFLREVSRYKVQEAAKGPIGFAIAQN
jgi:hypothetical protein